MFRGSRSFPLDTGFDERAFENIFLHNQYPGIKTGQKRSSKASTADKAELWALFDGRIHYHGLNLLRHLRTLWGIHATLQIGPRSKANAAVRGLCKLAVDKKTAHAIYFEGYDGNISDATKNLITIAPYSHEEKSRALSQKFFLRLVVPLKGLSALSRIDALLLAYSVAAFIDSRRFAGIVDPDLYLFVPPESVRAGLAHYHHRDRLLNTHLVAGFNFFEKDGQTIFFTHGLNRFEMPDLLIRENSRKLPLTTEHYAAALKLSHAHFLGRLIGAEKKKKPAGTPLSKRNTLPEQVAAMMGQRVVEVKLQG